MVFVVYYWNFNSVLVKLYPAVKDTLYLNFQTIPIIRKYPRCHSASGGNRGIFPQTPDYAR